MFSQYELMTYRRNCDKENLDNMIHMLYSEKEKEKEKEKGQ